MRQPGKMTSIGLIVAGFALFSGYVYFLRFPSPPDPRLSGEARREFIRVGELSRTFLYYAPKGLPAKSPLLLALHGSGETGEAFRWHSGYRFDSLADAEHFVVAYPDGFEQHWNDCRKSASYSARVRNIDDIGFVRALIDRFRTVLDIDPQRVFATGLSNGGQLSLRLALELPDQLRAVAAIGASLPSPANMDCIQSRKPIPVLLMNGTADPINPYGGGRVTIFGFGNRGVVQSSFDTCMYFADLGNVPQIPRREKIWSSDSSLWVERLTWGIPDICEIVLCTIHGGGHVVPQRISRYPRILGNTAGFDGPGEIWSFFARQPTVRRLNP